MTETIFFAAKTAEAPSFRAEILPAGGGHCTGLTAEWGGRVFPILEIAPPEEIRRSPTSYGCPILFPYANRIAGGTFFWRGQRYLADPPRHGLVRHRPWQVLEKLPARLTCETIVKEERVGFFSFHFRAEAVYELGEEGLTVHLTVSNLGEEFPYSGGFHPYLAADRQQAIHLEIPARRQAELTSEQIPTGNFEEVSGSFSFLAPGQALKPHEKYDDIFTSLEADEGGVARCHLCHAFPISKRGYETVISFRVSDFPFVCFYTPPNRNAVCLEPYTALTNALNHESDPQWGLRILPAGKTISFTATIGFRI